MKTLFFFLLLAGGGLCLAPPAPAGPRTSASYSVAADVTDAGGKNSSSLGYTNNGSIGTIGAVTTVSSPAETGKGGYIGQLYEITGLTLSTASTNVNSGSTAQLSAVAQLNDSSSLQIPGTQVVWSVVSGPVTSINSNGLATAGTVSQNTAATVRGDYLAQFGTLQVMVLAAAGNPVPVIVSFSITGNNLVLGGTNGAAGKNYYILTSTNVALPLTNWTPLATNSFDVNGNFRSTNGIDVTRPQSFFILHVP